VIFAKWRILEANFFGDANFSLVKFIFFKYSPRSSPHSVKNLWLRACGRGFKFFPHLLQFIVTVKANTTAGTGTSGGDLFLQVMFELLQLSLQLHLEVVVRLVRARGTKFAGFFLNFHEISDFLQSFNTKKPIGPRETLPCPSDAPESGAPS
jgi:hypothetical protein